MSEQGEFEKLFRVDGRVLDADIHRELTIDIANEERKVWSDVAVSDDEVYVTLDQIKKRIEEAKKEFPESKTFITHADANLVHEVDWDSYNEAMIAWKKKWFGS